MDFRQTRQELNTYFSRYPLSPTILLSSKRAQIIGSTVQYVYSYDTPGQSNDCLIHSFLSSYIPVFKYLPYQIKVQYATTLRRKVLVEFCKTKPMYVSKIPAFLSSFPLTDDSMDVLVSYFNINIYAIKRPGPDAPPNVIIESTPPSAQCVIINNIGNRHFETACITSTLLEDEKHPPDDKFLIDNTAMLISTQFLQDTYRPNLSPSFTEQEKKFLMDEEANRIQRLERKLEQQLQQAQHILSNPFATFATSASSATSVPNMLHTLKKGTRVFFNNTVYSIIQNDVVAKKYVVDDGKIESDMPYFVVDAWAKLTDPLLRFRVM